MKEFSRNYMKINLFNHLKKSDNLNVNVLINLKVTFPQHGNK